MTKIIEVGYNKYERFVKGLMITCIIGAVALFVLLIILFCQHKKIQLLEGKSVNDSIAIQSYKNLTPTQ